MIKFYLFVICFLVAIYLPAQKKGQILSVTKKIKLKSPGSSNLVQASGCDTVNYPVPDAWSVSYYVAGIGGNDGFVTGNNIHGDQEKAAYFNASASPNTYITKVWVAFAVANSNTSANLNKSIPIKVYDGTSGEPGLLLGSFNKLLSELRADAVSGFYSEVVFPSAITLPASKKFFVSVDITSLTWNQAGGYDSLAVYSNQVNQSLPGANGFGWEKSNNIWAPFSAGWGVDLSLVVHPFLSTNSTCSITLPTSITFSGKVFLQGAYNPATGTMNNTLNSSGILQANAATQPYNISGIDYRGPETVPANFFSTYFDIVDWILVELRDASGSESVIARRAAFIKQNGSLVDTDGLNDQITFSEVPFGNYYVAVRHRNHLPVRSSVTVDFTSGSGTYDFTSSLNSAFAGSVPNPPMATLAPNVFGMWGGNANDDVQVKMTGLTGAANDYLRLLNVLGSSTTTIPNVYSKQDLNMDGRVNMIGLSAATNDYLRLLNILGSSINQITQPAF